jgi:hypothetical protein
MRHQARSAAIKTKVSLETSSVLEDAQITELATILGRSLTDDELNEMELDVSGSYQQYRAATREEPEEGGCCEEIEVSYKGTDLTDFYEKHLDKDFEYCNEKLCSDNDEGPDQYPEEPDLDDYKDNMFNDHV